MKQFVVVGCGRFGSSVAKTLFKMGNDVMAIDGNEEIIQNISDEVTHAVQADATDEHALRSLGIRNFDVAVITIGSDIQSSIMTTLIVKELGVKYVVAKAQNELHAKVLYKIGADRVVFPERDMGMRVAHNLVASNILDYIELAPDYSIVEISALEEWEEKTLLELNIRSRFGINIMAIKHNNKINVSPTAKDIVHKGDILVVIGHKDDLRKIERG
ncbi:potassium channel family protein [Alkaliphilus peptidifermentans]|uniref:Trk system potassium uptake protein TrkA n=1 Tax=Alkaliphilus peptidifermentans DSM 18978 TaxID=1120976 RepID=A0A1G5IWL7_9FIRM|nr:TrkA family potassium uptake protein [Alkaliphilus peptidifermentans]SCY80284.1 trk system potassium uptake protein TrkA [Alkaliphilus peptidifermentans DSM 18978]